MDGDDVGVVNGKNISDRLQQVGLPAEHRGAFGKQLVAAMTGSL